MSADDQKALARRFFEALDMDRLDVLDAAVTPDYRFHLPDGSELTWEQHKQFHAAISAALGELSHALEDQFGEDDRVATRVTARGVHRGDLMGIPPTGKRLAIPATTIHRFSDGKIAEYWLLYDQLSLLGQLGVVPAPAQG